MIEFKTRTGSHYQLDDTKMQIRRLHGTRRGASRQAPDGEWQTFTLRTELAAGRRLGLAFDDQGDGIITSPVTEIVETGVASTESN